MQWGTNSNSNGKVSVNLPQSYTNTSYIIMVCDVRYSTTSGSSTGAFVSGYSSDKTKSSFVARQYDSSDFKLNWITIGT